MPDWAGRGFIIRCYVTFVKGFYPRNLGIKLQKSASEEALQTVEKVQPVLGFFHNLCYNNHG